MARRRFFVDKVRNGRAQIEGEEAHHLTRVLRVQVGQKYELSDDENVYLAEIEAAGKDLVSFVILERAAEPELLVHLTLVAALIKFDRFEWLLEKSTELGASAIIPFIAERSEKGLDRAAEKRFSRWNRIAREASEQSRRAKLPVLSDPLTFGEALGIRADIRLVLDEDPAAAPIVAVLQQKPQPHSCVALLVGPEGGWTERERSAFVEQGWTAVSLGATVLRAETAALAGIAIAMACCRNNSGPLGSST